MKKAGPSPAMMAKVFFAFFRFTEADEFRRHYSAFSGIAVHPTL